MPVYTVQFVLIRKFINPINFIRSKSTSIEMFFCVVDTTDPMVSEAGGLVTDDVDEVNKTVTTDQSNVDMRNKSNPELLHGYHGYRWRGRRCRHHRCCRRRYRHHHHCRRYHYRYYYYW
ncbi:hypothetical protein MN116_004177, partial [Schistosoma mekongi]